MALRLRHSERHKKWPADEGIRGITYARSTVLEQTFVSTSTHSLDSIDPAIESYWGTLSSSVSPSPLLYPSYTTLSLLSAFALLWQCWMSPIVLDILQPPRQTTSLFLSQSSPWSSPNLLCPQSQSRHILDTPLYHLIQLHIFFPRGDAGSVGVNRECPGSSSS